MWYRRRELTSLEKKLKKMKRHDEADGEMETCSPSCFKEVLAP